MLDICRTEVIMGRMVSRRKKRGPRTPAEIAADAKRTGRRPKGDTSRTKIVQMRVTEDELAELKRRAAELGLTVTDFLRREGGLEE